MHPTSILRLFVVSFGLFAVVGCAATPQPTSSLPADAWIPPGSVEMSFASRETRPAAAVSHETLVTGLHANAPASRRHLLRAVR